MVRGGVEAAHDVEQVAVGLEVDTELARATMGERHPERGRKSVAEARAPAAAAGSLGLPVPEPARPALPGAVGEYPILVLDDLPDLGREHGGRQRLRRALKADRSLPLGAERGVPEGDALRAGAAFGGGAVVAK